MRIKARFLHKVLALVLIPVALAAGCTAYALTRMFDEVIAEGQQQRDLMLATADLADIYEKIAYPVAGFLLSRGQNRDCLQPDKIVSDETQINGYLQTIQKVVSNDRQGAIEANAVEGNVKAAFVLIDQASVSYQQANKPAAMEKLRELAQITSGLKEHLNALHGIFNQKLEALMQQQLNMESRYHIVVVVLLSVSGLVFLLAVCSAYAISRYFQPRMQILIDNLHRLPRQQQLRPMPADDEFADLNGVVNDISSALDAARQQREEMDKLKQDFVAMVSHDLRTPLASIQLFVSMLAKGMLGDVNDKVKEKAGAADRNASRLIRLINDLLDMEKLGSGQLVLDCSQQDVRGLIERSIDSVRAFAEKSSITVRATECGDTAVTVDGDRVVQVLVNFLGNAIKFSPPQSTVWLSVEASDEFVTFKVKDEGRGIPPNMQTTIFERFKQVDAKDAVEKQGSGLGLAICKAIVEQHGGSIGVESAAGKGSTFWFTVAKVKMPTAAIAF